ncbi:MAG: esterase [Chitinophagaceae bacterium]|nr:esterase [Chitinophagaceae bacterium]
MTLTKQPIIRINKYSLPSAYLNRTVRVVFYYPPAFGNQGKASLLLINDGQDMEKLSLEDILSRLYRQNLIRPVFCAAIFCGEDRKNEYGTAGISDYKGRGAKAGLYTRFILEELLPFIDKENKGIAFVEKSFAGFSLGGLSALDIVWNHSDVFSKAGVFSGSLWWRSKGLDEGYVEDRDRIMHAQIRAGVYHKGLKFFFETGTLDETCDRNNNGIIDSIDDTLGLIDELVQKGYNKRSDIKYLELKDGKHDVATWARAMPEFLKWGWGK